MFKGEFAVRRPGGKAPPALLRSATSPLREEALRAGFAREKGSPQCGELAEPARPEGLYPPAFGGHFPVIHTI